MAVKKTAGKTTRVSPQKRDEGKKVASRKATSGTVSAATSKSAQKAKAAQLSKPGKVSESGTWQVAAIKAGKELLRQMTSPKAGTPRLPAKPVPRGKGSSTPKPKKPASADTQRKIAAEMRATRVKAEKDAAIKNAARADRAKAGKAADARQAKAEKYKAVYGSKTDRTYDRKPLGPSGKKPTSQPMKDSKGNTGWR